jgi:hypothetical protein
LGPRRRRTQRICEYVWENSCRVRWNDRNYPVAIFRAGDRFARKIIEDTTVILFGSNHREVKRFIRAEYIALFLHPKILPNPPPAATPATASTSTTGTDN